MDLENTQILCASRCVMTWSYIPQAFCNLMGDIAGYADHILLFGSKPQHVVMNVWPTYKKHIWFVGMALLQANCLAASSSPALWVGSLGWHTLN